MADEAMLKQIRNDIINTIIPRVKGQLKPELQRLFNNDIVYHINPTGKL